MFAPILFSPLGGTDQFNKKSELIFQKFLKKMKFHIFPNIPVNNQRLNPEKKKKYLNRAMYLDKT